MHCLFQRRVAVRAAKAAVGNLRSVGLGIFDGFDDVAGIGSIPAEHLKGHNFNVGTLVFRCNNARDMGPVGALQRI
ncbi:hypothetical protein SDC9_173232 [bioreactor metagenome]|uniref:Uncharacterized protein n=1 Tax=bioreactor metagenome TaxID=1076179 RepID=A0A645GHZ8_9ZZZZ